MNKEPWLSILMPIYNGEAFLTYALDSIILQRDDNIECIVIDGESTDATPAILKSYQEKLPIKILQRERSTNWVTKTNFALSCARGEYVCFLHHDDLWLKDRLKTMKQLVDQFPKAVLLLHPSYFLDNNGNNLGLWTCPLRPTPEIINPNLMIERLLTQNFISILGPIFKRKAALSSGGLDESLWYTADWDFWLKIAACGDTIYYPRPLSGFRIHSSSQTIVRSSYAEDFRDQLERVLKKYFVLWEAREQLKQRVYKVAAFSIDVNVTLASATHGQKAKFAGILFSFLLLGPSGWYRYFRDSRIWERVQARLKAQLSPTKK